MITAEILMTIGGVSAFVLTLGWVRERELREKYAVVWILVAFALLIVGLFPSLVMTFAAYARLSYPAAVLMVALVVIYLFAFSVSVSISRQYRRNARLTQELALMEMRLRELERRVGESTAASPPR